MLGNNFKGQPVDVRIKLCLKATDLDESCSRVFCDLARLFWNMPALLCLYPKNLLTFDDWIF